MPGTNVRRAYVCGTLDTKAVELGFLADRLRAAGLPVCLVDLSTRRHGGAADIPAEAVARHHPDGAGAVLGQDDRGRAVAGMAVAFRRFLAGRTDLAGVIGAGGSGATAMLAPALRDLPVGLPKIIVSTVASGNVAQYVGASDIVLMPAVTDVQGINRISRRILGNAAHALAGMMQAPPDAAADDRPAIGLTMFGVTTACVQQVCAGLERDYDCITFHAVGTGGAAMEKLIESGLLTGAIDVTTTEICDMMMGGVFPAEATRFDAVIRTRIPYVVSCGALDMVNFAARDTVPARYAGRNLYAHNPEITLMRTTPDECVRMAEWIADKLNRMDGKVRLLLPEHGVSALDMPSQPFFDPAADAALFDTLEARVVATGDRQVRRLPCAVNDPAFAQALVSAFKEIAE